MDAGLLTQAGVDRIAVFINTNLGFSARTPEELDQEIPRRLSGTLAETWGEFRKRMKHMSSSEPSAQEITDFLLDCGAYIERLKHYREMEFAATAAATVSHDGILPEPLEADDLDAIAKFITWRDRIFRRVADYTLKGLVVCGILFIVGLVFGIL